MKPRQDSAMSTRQQTIDTLKAEILQQSSAAEATEYVYWVMVPAAQQQTEETGDITVTTEAGAYSMSDVVNHAARAAREIEQQEYAE